MRSGSSVHHAKAGARRTGVTSESEPLPINVRNDDPDTAHRVMLVDTLPPSVYFDSASSTSGSSPACLPWCMFRLQAAMGS